MMIAGRRGQEELRTSAGPDRQTPEQTQEQAIFHLNEF